MRRWRISKGLVASGTGNQIGEWREQQHVQGPPSPPVEVIEAAPVIEALRGYASRLITADREAKWGDDFEAEVAAVTSEIEALLTHLEPVSPPPHGQAE